jgi:tRNA (cytidine/uridine-2'-O-)-methyltransferase
MKIVLCQPQIPQNTGNIVRTCAVTGNDLILVEPLGFSVSDRWLKRSGLDYWEGVNVQVIDDLPKLLQETEGSFYFFSSKAKKCYSNIAYKPNDLLIFGAETSGLPAEFWQQWPENFATLPMRPGVRCLNLATSAGIVIYEAWRQNHFAMN